MGTVPPAKDVFQRERLCIVPAISVLMSLGRRMLGTPPTKGGAQQEMPGATHLCFDAA